MAASVAAFGARAGLETTTCEGDIPSEKLNPVAIYNARLIKALDYDRLTKKASAWEKDVASTL